MKNERKISLILGEYIAKSFFHDEDYQGVEIFDDVNNRLGSITGLSIPDENDETECKYFDDEVEEWLIYNDY